MDVFRVRKKIRIVILVLIDKSQLQTEKKKKILDFFPQSRMKTLLEC